MLFRVGQSYVEFCHYFPNASRNLTFSTSSQADNEISPHSFLQKNVIRVGLPHSISENLRFEWGSASQGDGSSASKTQGAPHCPAGAALSCGFCQACLLYLPPNLRFLLVYSSIIPSNSSGENSGHKESLKASSL